MRPSVALLSPMAPLIGAPGQVLACRSSEQACEEVETTASAGPGEPCYLFGDSCVPPGWRACEMEIGLD
jgi:hypothetical protein